MSKAFNIHEITEGILASNIAYVSKAITLVESTKAEHQEQAQEIINALLWLILQVLLPYSHTQY